MDKKMIRSGRARAVTAALLATGAGQATAAGFMIVEQSVHEVGRAVSGATAAADNLGTLFFNPAGITRFDGTQGATALHIIMPTAEFGGSADTNIPTGAPPPFPSTLPISGASDETDEIGLVPNLYLVADINDKLKFGLGVNAPFGLVTDYDADWVGRYHAIKSDLKTININPTLGYQATDKLSLGFGINVMYADVELTNALDGVLTCANATAAIVNGTSSPTPGQVGAQVPGCIGALGTTPGAGGADGKAKLEGDDWGFGFNFGLLYQVNDQTRLGFAYRSQVEQTLEGSATTNFILPLAGGPVTNVELIQADLTLPDTVSVGLHHRYSDRWAVMADVAWTQWSDFDELKATSRTDGSLVLQQPENWDDTWRYSVGLEYTPDRAWTFRGGVAFDETPIPSPELRTPRIPGEDRTWIALGLTYAPSDRLTVDVAYAHLFVDDSAIDNTDASFGFTLTGEFENSVDILSAQLSYRF